MVFEHYPSPSLEFKWPEVVCIDTRDHDRAELAPLVPPCVMNADEISENHRLIMLRDGIFDMHRLGNGYPARENFYVAAPAVFETKFRYGRPWFDSK